MLAIDVSIPNRTVARRYADWTVATPLEYTRRVSKKLRFAPEGRWVTRWTNSQEAWVRILDGAKMVLKLEMSSDEICK